MDPLLIGGIGMAAAGGLYDTIAGSIQASKGKKMLKNTVAPTYRRPGEVKTALSLAENDYLTGFAPGISNLRDQINLANANAVDTATQMATSSGDVLDAVTKLDYNHGQKLNDLALQEQQLIQDNKNQYINQLLNNADYTDKEFEINEWSPYENKIAEAQALIGAGNLNVKQGVGSLSKLGAGLATNSMNNKIIYDPSIGKVS